MIRLSDDALDGVELFLEVGEPVEPDEIAALVAEVRERRALDPTPLPGFASDFPGPHAIWCDSFLAGAPCVCGAQGLVDPAKRRRELGA